VTSRALVGSIAATALLLAGGCGGSGGVDVTSVTTAQGNEPAARYAALQALDTRVAHVFHALVTANVELCSEPGRSAGWALHAANQYGSALRPVAIAGGDLEGDLPGIVSVAPGGAAERAGLLAGDLIVSVDGRALSVGERDARESYAGVAGNLAILNGALAAGSEVRLGIRRDGVVVPARLTGDPACPYTVHVDVSDELNARADGAAVFISSALATFATTDDELALILAHELAHNILKHRERFDREAPARRVFGNLAVAPSSLAAAERDADRWGLYLMARAGFDEQVAAPFWRRFGAANWRVRWAQWGHPAAETRARQLEGVGAEIDAARASGRAIDPR